MKKALVLFAVIFVFIVMTGTVIFAEQKEQQSEQNSNEQAIKAMLIRNNATVESIKDIGDLYETVVNFSGHKNIVYITKNLQYIVIGAIFNPGTMENLTAAKYQEINKVDFSKIPLNDAITITKGNGSKKLVMLTDPDCPFCKQAFQWLMTQNNFTLYVFLVPIEQLHPQAKAKSVQILCSKDAVKALKEIEEGKTLKEKQCEEGLKKLAKHALVGEILQLQGTPLFVLENGQKVEGFIKNVLEKYFKGELK
ncbi:DsbC family protein [Thermodesulfovibrio sp. TK110]